MTVFGKLLFAKCARVLFVNEATCLEVLSQGNIGRFWGSHRLAGNEKHRGTRCHLSVLPGPKDVAPQKVR